jgi:hypothetical protein
VDARIRFGLLFFSLMFNTLTSIQLIPNLMDQRFVYYLQASNGYFRRFNFYASYMLLEIPQSLVHTFSYMLVVYPMSGFRDGLNSNAFGYYALTVLTSNLCGKAWSLFLSAVCTSQEAAHALAPVTISTAALLPAPVGCVASPLSDRGRACVLAFGAVLVVTLNGPSQRLPTLDGGFGGSAVPSAVRQTISTVMVVFRDLQGAPVRAMDAAISR